MGRGEPESGALAGGVDTVAVGGEEGKGISGTRREDDAKGVAAGDLVEDFDEVEDGLGPGLKGREANDMSTGVIEL
jgi:hypothetical protein